jgi:rhomboid protease GluP
MSPLYLQEYPADRKIICALIVHNQMGMRLIKLSQDEIILEKSLGLFSESCILTIDVERNWIQTSDLSKATYSIILDDYKNSCNQCAETLTSEQVKESYIDLMSQIPLSNGAVYEQRLLTKKEKFLPLFDAIIPQQGNWVTPLIILLNILYFIWMLVHGVHFFSPSTEHIIDYGGNVKELVAAGEWWRLIACTFIHIGFVHLFFNMISLYSVGKAIETYIKPLPFAMIYISCGIAGSVLSVLYLNQSVSAGASGAIFGMYGFLFALYTTNLFTLESKKEVLLGLGSIIGINLFMGFSARIDNAGHVGGLIMGVVLGYIAYLILRRTINTIWIGVVSLFLALVFSFYVLTQIS